MLAKRSDTYRFIRNQVTDFKPHDVWEDEDHIFVEFILKEQEGVSITTSIKSSALFIVAKHQHIIIDVRVVRPDRKGINAMVKSLVFPTVNFIVPLPALSNDIH